MSDVSVSIARDAAATVASVHGEIDMTNAEAFGQELGAAADAAAGRFVVDLGGVPYLDSAGVGHLFAVAARLVDRGVPLAVVVPEGSPLRKLLRIVQLDQVAAVVEDRAAALDSAPPEGPP